MLDVSRILYSRTLSQPDGFIVYRKSGSWVSGQWLETETSLTMHGPVMPANAEELEQVPEGDRKKGAMVFYCTQELRCTTEANAGTSDQVVWNGARYRITNSLPWKDFGYYKAIGVAMGGK